jgi:phage terminase large subunit
LSDLTGIDINAEISGSQRKLNFYIKRWRNYALSFHIEALRADRYWYPNYHQYRLCCIRDTGIRKIAISAGRGNGKTAWEAGEDARHHICYGEEGKSIKSLMTAPAAGQLSSVIWAEAATVNERLLPYLGNKFIINNDGKYCLEDPKNWFTTPKTARKEDAENVQGLHGVVLNILDEATGIPDNIIKVVLAGMTEATQWAIVSGNPTRLSGMFYRIFNERPAGWARYFIDCYDNLTTQTFQYPYIDPFGKEHTITVNGIVTPEWIEEQKSELGENSPAFTAFVRGRFPINESDQIIKKDWVDRAWRGDEPECMTSLRVMGVDPGHESDPSAIVIRKGRRIEEAEQIRGHDPYHLSEKVMARCDELRIANKPVSMICVDTIGIGDGVGAILKANKYPVIGVKVSAMAPLGGTACYKLRDWLWWQGRNYFRDHNPKIMELTSDMKQLCNELTHPQYKPKNGKIVVESKDDMKRRGMKSPNLADAFLLTLRCDWKAPTKSEKSSLDIYRRNRIRKKEGATSWITV